MDKVKKAGNSDEGKTLTKCLDEALELIFSNKFSQSLEALKSLEKRLETGVNKGSPVDKDAILVTLHSTALCYQSLGNLPECCTYLEACIFNVKKGIDKANTQTVSPDKIRKIRYLALLNALLAEGLFKQSLFKLAAESAKTAMKHALLAVRLCLSACTELKFHKNSKTSQKFQETWQNSQNVLQSLYHVLNGKKVKKDSVFTIRSSIGVQKVADWVLNLTFEKILEIKPITLAEMKTGHSLSTELSKDFLFDKICLSITCLYELSKSLNRLNEEANKSKVYLQRGLKLASLFFPKTCPIFLSLSDLFQQKFQTLKKAKSPPRSTSVRFSPKMQEVLEKAKHSALKLKVSSKTHSARSSDTETGISKSSQTQSGSTIHNLKSLPKFEKTEPEPALSEESEKGEILKKFEIFSKELYGNYSEEEVDKYEYMPLRRDI